MGNDIYRNPEERSVIDRMWRNPPARAAFEKAMNFKPDEWKSDAYHWSFITWGLIKLRQSWE